MRALFAILFLISLETMAQSRGPVPAYSINTTKCLIQEPDMKAVREIYSAAAETSPESYFQYLELTEDLKVSILPSNPAAATFKEIQIEFDFDVNARREGVRILRIENDNSTTNLTTDSQMISITRRFFGLMSDARVEAASFSDIESLLLMNCELGVCRHSQGAEDAFRPYSEDAHPQVPSELQYRLQFSHPHFDAPIEINLGESILGRRYAMRQSSPRPRHLISIQSCIHSECTQQHMNFDSRGLDFPEGQRNESLARIESDFERLSRELHRFVQSLPITKIEPQIPEGP